MFHDSLLLFSGNHRSTSLKYLSIINGISINRIAEIGVYKGKNAKYLRMLFPEAELYLIDPWKLTDSYLKMGGPPSKKVEAYQEAYQEVCQNFKDDTKTHILRMSSVEAAKKTPMMDLVFIDASHDYHNVKIDIQTWKTKTTNGGILAGHDYHSSFPGVVKAVDQFLEDVILLPGDIWAYINK